jgi:sulfur-oxidizing protein SoxY
MGLTMEDRGITRRALLRALGSLGVASAAASAGFALPEMALAQAGKPEPEEKVDAAMKRLFGGRPIKDGAAMLKLEAPLIAENGSVVPVTVEVSAPMTPQSYVKNIYIIADKNRRPMTAKFSFTPDSGQAFIGANVRLGGTTDVRAIAEMSDGTLLMAKREVKVTVGGCGG